MHRLAVSEAFGCNFLKELKVLITKSELCLECLLARTQSLTQHAHILELTNVKNM